MNRLSPESPSLLGDKELESHENSVLRGRAALAGTENKHDLCQTCMEIQKCFNFFQDISCFTFGYTSFGWKTGKKQTEKRRAAGEQRWRKMKETGEINACFMTSIAGLIYQGDHIHQTRLSFPAAPMQHVCHVSQRRSAHISYEPGTHMLHAGLVGSSTTS